MNRLALEELIIDTYSKCGVSKYNIEHFHGELRNVMSGGFIEPIETFDQVECFLSEFVLAGFTSSNWPSVNLFLQGGWFCETIKICHRLGPIKGLRLAQKLSSIYMDMLNRFGFCLVLYRYPDGQRWSSDDDILLATRKKVQLYIASPYYHATPLYSGAYK